MSIKSKEEGKCQESTQLVPHLTQNTLWEGDKKQENDTYRSALRSAHTQGRHRAFQRGPTEETIHCRRHERVESRRGVSFHPIVRGSPPRFVYNFEPLLCSFLMGFNASGTRLQSLWILFFFVRKNIPCGVKNQMLDKILFRQL